jgi:hypothetical protein
LRFELRLEFDTFSHSNFGRRGIMSDWSEKAAQQVRMNKEAKFFGDKKAVLDEENRKRRAYELWKKLTDMFQQKCIEFNAEPGMANTLYFSSENSHKFETSLGRTGKRFKGEFDSSNYRFNFDSSTWKLAQSTLEVQIWIGCSDAEVGTPDSGPIDIDSFVNDHLESLLGIG